MDERGRTGDENGRRRLIARLRAFHPFPSILVAGLTAAIVPLADGDASAALYVELGVSMLLFQFAIGLVNDIADAVADAVAKPWKAVPSGALSRNLAMLIAGACAAGGLLLSAQLGVAAWLIGVAGLGCGLVYDLWLKRTPVSWLPYSVAFPLLPVWVFVAAERWDAILWYAFPLGGVLGFALHLANQAPDIEDDSTTGTQGFTGRLGERKARLISIALFAVVVQAAALIVAGHSTKRAVAIEIAGLLAALGACIGTRWLGRDGPFGVLAGGSAVIAVILLSVA